MNETASAPYNPTVNDLVVWATKRADFYRRTNDSLFDRAFDADQMSRIAEALSGLMAAGAAGKWTPVADWTKQEGEPVLLRLEFQYRPELIPLVQYDVGIWRRSSVGGDWEKCRSGRVTHCAPIAQVTPL